MENWQKLTFDVPINESITENDSFMIKGTAINATTTRNGTIFLAEELAKSAKTLRNKPILADHDNSINSIVGRTTKDVNFDQTSEAILFEGVIKNEAIINKINEGLIDSVSVGATYKDIEYNEDDTYTLKGIEFLELSLVAVPADKNATFTKAVTESFNLRNKATEEIQKETHKEEKSKMAEENVEMEKLKATNEEMSKELETFRAEEAARKAVELEILQKEYKDLATSLNIETRDVSNVSSEALGILIEDLTKIQEQEEAEPEVEEEAEEEAEEESEAEEEAEDEAEDEAEEKEDSEEKMKGKVNKEISEDVLNEFVFTTEEVSKGYGLYKENSDNPKYKR